MKKDIHPDYRPVVFQDRAVDYSFLTKSTVRTNETIDRKSTRLNSSH